MESRFGSLLAPSAPATMRLDERHATVGLSPRALIAQKKNVAEIAYAAAATAEAEGRLAPPAYRSPRTPRTLEAADVASFGSTARKTAPPSTQPRSPRVLPSLPQRASRAPPPGTGNEGSVPLAPPSSPTPYGEPWDAD
jgi:hypothetical protein